MDDKEDNVDVEEVEICSSYDRGYCTSPEADHAWCGYQGKGENKCKDYEE